MKGTFKEILPVNLTDEELRHRGDTLAKKMLKGTGSMSEKIAVLEAENERLRELRSVGATRPSYCPTCSGYIQTYGVTGNGTLYRCSECGSEWEITAREGGEL